MAIPFEGLPQLQTSYNLQLAEIMTGQLQREQMIREARMQNMVEYLRQIEARRHAEAEAKRRRQQQLIGQIAGLGAAAVGGPLIGAAFGGGGAATSAAGFNLAPATTTSFLSEGLGGIGGLPVFG